MDKIIIIDKPLHLSSFDVVAKMRKVFNTKRVGHAGTLDPLASGVLVVMLNKATKISNYLVMDNKQYIASFQLGKSTTTQDLEGDIVQEKTYLNDITLDKLKSVLASFEGIQMQTPSIYSAIKVNGKKLYEYARNNEEVVIPQREIDIKKIELLDFVDDIITIKVDCSSGTYIRSLCFDIANALGYPGVVTFLRRTVSGPFSIEQANNLEDVLEGRYHLCDIKDGLVDYDNLCIEDNQIITDIKNGKPLKVEMAKDFIVSDKEGNVLALFNASINGLAKMKRGLW